MVVCSCQKHFKMIYQSGAIPIFHENRPLGKKWNYGLSQAKKLDWDYLQIMGSDDLMSIGAFKHYKDVDLNGFLDFYVFDSKTKLGAYWKGYDFLRKNETIGAGRLISREIVEACNWKLWNDDLNKGLDRSFSRTIFKSVTSINAMRLKDINECLIDIKSSENLGGFHKYNNHIKKDIKETIKKFYPTYVQRIFEVK